MEREIRLFIQGLDVFEQGLDFRHSELVSLPFFHLFLKTFNDAIHAPPIKIMFLTKKYSPAISTHEGIADPVGILTDGTVEMDLFMDRLSFSILRKNQSDSAMGAVHITLIYFLPTIRT